MIHKQLTAFRAALYVVTGQGQRLAGISGQAPMFMASPVPARARLAG
jgi:hypothetical protein